MKKLAIGLLGLVLACFAACSTAGESDETASVRQAVERYLSSRTDLSLSSMRVVVDQVTVEGDRANAKVTIVARNDPQAKMDMMYRLRKTADGWEVEPPQGSEAGAHSGGAVSPSPQPDSGAEMPPGHPPVGGSQGSSEQGGGAGELPPGHPPVKN